MRKPVTRSDKDSVFGEDYLVKAIGGEEPDGSCWRLSAEEAIARIESGNAEYFVEVNGVQYDVTVGDSEGTKYLLTALDGDVPIILLALPDISSEPSLASIQ